MTEIGDFTIFHLLSSPYYNRRSKPITIDDVESGGLHTMFVGNKFYPAILPETDQLVSLTVTTDSIENQVKAAISQGTELVLVDPHPTKIDKNFVSYGKIIRVTIPESMYDLYLDLLNFQVAFHKPVPLKRSDRYGTRYIPISHSRHFHINSVSARGREEADCSFSVLLIRLTKDSFRGARDRDIVRLGGKGVKIVSFHGNFLVLKGEDMISLPIILQAEFPIYKRISQEGEGVYICHVYTVYNVTVEGKEQRESNFLINAFFYDYSLETLLPFVLTKLTSAGLVKRGETKFSTLQSLRDEALSGFLERDKNVRSSKRWLVTSLNGGKINISIANPDIISRFLRGYVLFPRYRRIIGDVLMSENLISSMAEIYNALEAGQYYRGELIEPGFKTFMVKH